MGVGLGGGGGGRGQVLVVHAHVPRALVATGESPGADLTRERLFSSMRAHVGGQVVAAAKRPPTHAAREWALSGVNAEMAGKLVRAREPPVTAVRRARERPIGDRRPADAARVLARLHRHQRGPVAQVLLQAAHVGAHVGLRPVPLPHSADDVRLRPAQTGHHRAGSDRRRRGGRQFDGLLFDDRHVDRLLAVSRRRLPRRRLVYAAVVTCRDRVAVNPAGLRHRRVAMDAAVEVTGVARRLSTGGERCRASGRSELERARRAKRQPVVERRVAVRNGSYQMTVAAAR